MQISVSFDARNLINLLSNFSYCAVLIPILEYKMLVKIIWSRIVQDSNDESLVEPFNSLDDYNTLLIVDALK